MPYPKRHKKLAVVMMVKNEAERISQTTLPSILEYCGTLIIFDTGSTDNTVDILRSFCEKHYINFHLKQGEFVDFSTSRNIMLDFADEVLKNEHYLLLLDAHDELQEGDNLYNFISNYKGTCSGFYLTQRWKTSNDITSYFNVRLIKSHMGWRYRHCVHEYITNPALENKTKTDQEMLIKVQNIFLYQDRTQDDDKSMKRFARDKEMLYSAFLKDKHESRTIFYLAQTCGCLGHMEEAYQYYLLRIKEAGFFEEIFHAFCRLGDCAVALGHDWEESFMWYMKAFQHSQRAEPLIKIAQYYKEHNLQGENTAEWQTCFIFAHAACSLIYPVTQILFVNRKNYIYDRWHLLGISAYYVGKYKEGKEACLKAIEAENLDIDKQNLSFYLQKELEVLRNGGTDFPALFSCTYDDKEIRPSEDTEIKHDRKSILSTIAKNVLQNYKDLPANVIQEWIVKNIGESVSHKKLKKLKKNITS